METSACVDVGTISGQLPNGIIADLSEELHPEVIGPARLEWHRARAVKLLVGSDVVVRSSSEEGGEETNRSGVYFLLVHGKICYVGQATNIGTRLDQHQAEGRPFQAVAMLVGIPKWAQNEIEHAYIRAWDPPWNDEYRRSGYLDDMPDYQELANALDKSAVMPWYTPRIDRLGRKKWQNHLIGYQQHLDREKAAQSGP